MSTFSSNIVPQEEDGAGWIALAPSKKELQAEAWQADIERDAARYRWLRAGNYSLKIARSLLNDTPYGIDSAVDAAMRAR